ncbi:MAG: GFA family protein [Lysobacter sp.]
MTSYAGSCHCGKIAYRVEGQIEQVLDCNCSMCQRRGGLLWFVPRTAFTLETDAADVSTYHFNKKKIDHHFCRDCGISPYSEANAPDGTEMTAINVRCLEGIDLKSITVVSVDGRSF